MCRLLAGLRPHHHSPVHGKLRVLDSAWHPGHRGASGSSLLHCESRGGALVWQGFLLQMRAHAWVGVSVAAQVSGEPGASHLSACLSAQKGVDRQQQIQSLKNASASVQSALGGVQANLQQSILPGINSTLGLLASLRTQRDIAQNQVMNYVAAFDKAIAAAQEEEKAKLQSNLLGTVSYSPRWNLASATEQRHRGVSNAHASQVGPQL